MSPNKDDNNNNNTIFSSAANVLGVFTKIASLNDHGKALKVTFFHDGTHHVGLMVI